MLNRSFFNFLFLYIYNNRVKELIILILLTFMLFILISVMFISNSIQHSINSTIDNHATLVVQKLKAGRVVDIPNDRADEYSMIFGVDSVYSRVYGEYYHKNKHFTIVGIDLFNEYSIGYLKEITESIDIKEFLSKNSMIVGKSVRDYLESNYYNSYYNFRLSSGDLERVYIYDNFKESTNLLSSDMIIMNIDLARNILDIDDDFSTDLALDVPNISEVDNIIDKIVGLYLDVRVIKKEDMQLYYKKIFDYKSGFFLVLFITSFMTFLTILYQRYSTITNKEKREIGVLKAIGWSISSIVQFKLYQALLLSIMSFMLATIFAYLYVFYFNAPILIDIYFGSSNLDSSINLDIFLDISNLLTLFLLTVIPFVAISIVPAWKIATIDPLESIK